MDCLAMSYVSKSWHDLVLFIVLVIRWKEGAHLSIAIYTIVSHRSSLCLDVRSHKSLSFP